MRLLRTALIAAVAAAMSAGAYAELQSVEVGGQIRIRGNYFNYDRGQADTLRGRFFNQQRIGTYYDTSFVEQRTRLNFKADFTDDVTAFIEFDSYDVWGEDFRSNYITGVDSRAVTGNDVEVYQAYIEANDMWGVPLRLRVGRQEISLGSEWLIGTNDQSWRFTGLSFDAVRASYVTDLVTVDAIWAKLNERFGDVFNDDTDLYILYASYTGLEEMVFDAYWMFLREDNAIPGPFAPLDNRAPGYAAALGGDDADIHTVGLRSAGMLYGFDYEAEVAYQMGEIDRARINFFRDNDLEYGKWGANLEVGYTFDLMWTPRVYAGAAYFEGNDPTMDRPRFFRRLRGNDETDISFNRMFSNWEYSEFLANTHLSNAFIWRGGVSAMPTERLAAALTGTFFQADDDRSEDELGLELGLYLDYNYSEDLVFRTGWAHFFAYNDGLEDANLVRANGLLPLLGDEDDDYDYLFVETELTF